MMNIYLTDLVSQTKAAIKKDTGIWVPCRGCVQCCKLPVHLTEEEKEKLGIDFMPTGKDGFCGYLISGKCTIYDKRPSACRRYDCRPDFITRAMGYKSTIKPTTEHKVIIDDEKLLLQLVLTTEEIIGHMKKDTGMKTNVWHSSVSNYEKFYESFRKAFGF